MALEDLEEALEDPADLKAITALTVDLVAVIIMVDSGVQEGLAEDLKVVLEAVPEVGGFQETKTADSLEDLEDITTIMVRVVSVAVILVLEALEEDPVVQVGRADLDMDPAMECLLITPPTTRYSGSL